MTNQMRKKLNDGDGKRQLLQEEVEMKDAFEFMLDSEFDMNGAVDDFDSQLDPEFPLEEEDFEWIFLSELWSKNENGGMGGLSRSPYSSHHRR